MITHTGTHATLLARLAKDASPGGRDGAAWAEFLDRYGDLLRGFCRNHGVRPGDVDDVLQDVLLNLSRAMPGFVYDPAKGKFRSYLKTVTLHAIYARFRQNRRAPALGTGGDDMSASAASGPAEAAPAPPEDDPACDAAWEREWRQYHVRRAMAVLRAEVSARDMVLFERYAIGGEMPEVIASECGTSLDVLYQVKSRMTRRLSAIIQDHVNEEG